jgi:hypothetical protein
MTQRNDILAELLELNSNLGSAGAVNPYVVPAGYFENLCATVLARIKALDSTSAATELEILSPLLSGLSKKMPFSVPSGYFETLEEKITTSVQRGNDWLTASEETESISPFLGGLKKQMPYTVPQGYFDGLGNAITGAPSKEEAKVVSLSHRKWFKYAAAAIITAAVAVSGLLFFNNKKEVSGGAIAKITKDVKKMDETQKDNLIDFIDAGLNGKEQAKATVDNKSKEIRELLKDVPEEELKDMSEQTEDIQDVLMTN